MGYHCKHRKEVVMLLLFLLITCGCASKKPVMIKKSPAEIYWESQGGVPGEPLILKKQQLKDEATQPSELGKYREEKVWLDEEEAYTEGYRNGVKENIQQFAREFYGSPFPYYYWQAPLVQKVYIPARIVGGTFQPAHWEYVIILPGQWREKFGYPITPSIEKSQEKEEGGK